jgi:SPP1 family predicted phage head-tail adaptor
MRAGRLRKRVILQTATETQDSYGQAVRTWADTITVYAGVEPINGREQYRAQAERAELTHLVVIRFRPDVLPINRVVHGTRTFDVEAVVNPFERNKELHLLCRENVE